MRQGEIWEVYFNPTQGSEQSGRRPAVIVSGTSIKNYKGNVVLGPTAINGLKASSEILTFHIRSISQERLVSKIGEISTQELEKIKGCLNDILRF